MQTSQLITDEQSLVGATSKFGHSIPVYDEGFGQLYIHRDSMGISGIVRAQTWEDAYSICEDEFFPEADETIGDFKKEFGEDFYEDGVFMEQYGFRSNGQNSRDKIGHGIYAKDLNGDSLEVLTPELLKALEITLQVEDSE